MNKDLDTYTVGIDGCRAGWCAVTQFENKWEFGVFKDIKNIIRIYPDASHYMIDMPMGLGDIIVKRDVDSKLRTLLKPRHSTVFSAPCREVLGTSTYREANLVNKQVTGKGISVQSWNLLNKIKELDTFLEQRSFYKNYFFESSPELCFAGLSRGYPILEKKSTEEGLNKRKHILLSNKYFSGDPFNELLRKFNRSMVKMDDILDASVLCLSGVLGKRFGFEQIENSSASLDSNGIPMRALYYLAPENVKENS